MPHHALSHTPIWKRIATRAMSFLIVLATLGGASAVQAESDRRGTEQRDSEEAIPHARTAHDLGCV